MMDFPKNTYGWGHTRPGLSGWKRALLVRNWEKLSGPGEREISRGVVTGFGGATVMAWGRSRRFVLL